MGETSEPTRLPRPPTRSSALRARPATLPTPSWSHAVHQHQPLAVADDLYLDARRIVNDLLGDVADYPVDNLALFHYCSTSSDSYGSSPASSVDSLGGSSVATATGAGSGSGICAELPTVWISHRSIAKRVQAPDISSSFLATRGSGIISATKCRQENQGVETHRCYASSTHPF